MVNKNDPAQQLLDMLKLFNETEVTKQEGHFSTVFVSALADLERHGLNLKYNPGLYMALAYGMLYGKEHHLIMNPKDENERIH